MKNELLLTRVFLYGVFLAAAVLSPFILDFTLLPRFILLSAVLLAVLFLLRSHYASLRPRLDAALIFYALYVCTCAASLAWAQNKAEALFSIEKTVLSF